MRKLEDEKMTKCLAQVNNHEIVVNFFISAITCHDIQQLSINLPEFTQFVQLMNRLTKQFM